MTELDYLVVGGGTSRLAAKSRLEGGKPSPFGRLSGRDPGGMT
jgi:hypothetical protein